ncbi:MAG: hypothetical protein COA75_05955 [Cellvibrionales bacterium]|nr:MAG: hypothetical protein COA75_05955 [Cellvibrionales bacterium]
MKTTPKLIIKHLFPLLLLMVFNNAHATATYKVHLTKNFNGANILAEPNKVNAPGSLTILKLRNFDKRTVKCKAIFDPRIEQEKSFTRQLEPNTKISIRYTTARTPNQLNIKLVCKPIGDLPPADAEVPAADTTVHASEIEAPKKTPNKDIFTVSKP